MRYFIVDKRCKSLVKDTLALMQKSVQWIEKLMLKVRLLYVWWKRIRLPGEKSRWEEFVDAIPDCLRFRKKTDHSLTWFGRIFILGFAIIVGGLTSICVVYLLNWQDILKVNKVFQSATVLGIFGLISSLGNWWIKNDDTKKQFNDTFIGQNELIFSNAVKALFQSERDKRSFRIHAFKEIIELSENKSIKLYRINSAISLGHDLRGMELEDSILIKFDLRNAKLEGAYFLNIDAREINLQNAKLSNVVFDTVNLRRANLIDTHFERYNTLGDTEFKPATLGSVDLRNALLDNANFQGVEFKEGWIGGGRLLNTDFRGAIFRAMDLTEAYLSKAKLEGAQYDNKTEFMKGFNPEKYGMVKI